MSTFLLFVVLTVPGHRPQPFSTPMPNLQECLEEVSSLLTKPPEILEGGSLQAGCVLQFEPSQKN